MAASFGLYFGNTNLCLAIHKDGNTEAVANDSGDRVTPAVVAFSNGEKSVGLAAKSEMVRNPTGTICNLKSLLMATEDELSQLAQESPCKIVFEGGSVHFDVSSGSEDRKAATKHARNDVLVYLFRKMFEVAESQGSGDEDYPVVVTVPPDLNDDQRQLIRETASKAGFRVLRLVNEPTMAALAYHMSTTPSLAVCQYLVYRLGGRTTSASVVSVCNGAYRLTSHAVAEPRLGGRDFTAVLVEHCVQEYQRQTRANLRESRRALAKLWNAAETAKHVLATLDSAQCFAESVHDGMDLSINISRARFESLMGPLLSRCIEPIDHALAMARLGVDDIEKVVLCGGSGRIQRVRNLLASRFPTSQILDSHAPDEVIAIGGALQAALLCARDDVTRDIPRCPSVPALSKGIYIKGTPESTLVPVLPEGTPVPAKWQKQVAKAAGHNSVCLEVYERAEDQPDCEATLLARLCVRELEEDSVLVASISVRSDGSAHLSISDKRKGRTESATLEGTVEVEPPGS
ncbi:heat shock 70 kDa protein 14 [Ixodes scapularis]|uniref:heat shock 70 kDa protein 14 n=1 Tax=Ixodes scapularis TaxID=6945 RepID=UPI001A9E5963|nr:heat shock 70 kDa protein 14 [Ixodes scapularis]